MSNKTRLQTNNTNLQTLINKANSLPDAGSGGAVETCSCSIGCDAPVPGTYTVTYTNASMQFSTKEFEAIAGTQIEVVKGTIVTIAPWSGMSSSSGNCIEIFIGSLGGAYFIAGESSITLEG